jgi:hypothetical protein
MGAMPTTGVGGAPLSGSTDELFISNSQISRSRVDSQYTRNQTPLASEGESIHWNSCMHALSCPSAHVNRFFSVSSVHGLYGLPSGSPLYVR